MSLPSQCAVHSNEAVHDNEAISDITVSQLVMIASYFIPSFLCSFFAASGQSYPVALQTLMDDDIISISHDALASLLQPIINVSKIFLWK